MSFPMIGGYFSKDHSTVIHACNTIQKRIEAEPGFRTVIEELERGIALGPAMTKAA
jgi:chromosomal replication initiation ATPase DnaA